MIVFPVKENVDERFLMHRLKATSLAGVVGGVFASLLFAYYFFATDALHWDLLAVAVVIALVKLSALAWYRLRD